MEDKMLESYEQFKYVKKQLIEVKAEEEMRF